jgi:hypothetical protein
LQVSKTLPLDNKFTRANIESTLALLQFAPDLVKERSIPGVWGVQADTPYQVGAEARQPNSNELSLLCQTQLVRDVNYNEARVLIPELMHPVININRKTNLTVVLKEIEIGQIGITRFMNAPEFLIFGKEDHLLENESELNSPQYLLEALKSGRTWLNFLTDSLTAKMSRAGIKSNSGETAADRLTGAIITPRRAILAALFDLLSPDIKVYTENELNILKGRTH